MGASGGMGEQRAVLQLDDTQLVTVEFDEER
jgi:hypothetical protein